MGKSFKYQKKFLGEITSILNLEGNFNIQILPESKVIIHQIDSNNEITLEFMDSEFRTPSCYLDMGYIRSSSLAYLGNPDISWKLYVGNKIIENKELINNLFVKYGKKIWDEDFKEIP